MLNTATDRRCYFRLTSHLSVCFWYCGATVFELIGCRSLALNLALPTSFNNNNNKFSYLFHIYRTITIFSSQQTGQLIGIGILTQTFIFRAQSLYCIYESFQGKIKIIHAEND